MKNSRQSNCDDVVELLVKKYWSKSKADLNRRIAEIDQDFANRGLSNTTSRISHQLHAEFEYLQKLLDYLIKSIEKDYSYLPLATCKNTLLKIVDEEYKKLIPRTAVRLTISNFSQQGMVETYENGILGEMEKAKETIEIQCTLSEKVKVATKPAKEKWYKDRQIQAALIGAAVLMFVSAVGWLIFLNTNNETDDASETTKIPTEAETNAVSSDPIRTAMGRTSLYARTRRRVDELEHMLINEKLMPWRLLPTGRPIEVTDYYGKTLHFEGVMFSGSIRLVFWSNFIEPFIENGIVEVLDATAEDCRNNNLEPKPYFEEAASLLDAMIRMVYHFMAETDQRLLGRDRQQRKDVSYEIAKMSQLLKEHTEAALLLFSESEGSTTRSRAILSGSETSIEPEEKEADVNRSGLPPIFKIPEGSIAPEEAKAEVNQPEPKPIIKKDEPSIKPEDTQGKMKKREN